MKKIFSRRLTALLVACLVGLSACSSTGTGSSVGVFNRPSSYFPRGAERDLLAAIASGKLDKLDATLDQGADPNAVGRKGMTPLFFAISCLSTSAFEQLLSRGANPNQVSEVPTTVMTGSNAAPMNLAALADDPIWLELALKYGGQPDFPSNTTFLADKTIIFDSILQGRFENVRLLVSHGADVNFSAKNGATPLGLAIVRSQFEVARYLADNGADTANDYVLRALAFAVDRERLPPDVKTFDDFMRSGIY